LIEDALDQLDRVQVVLLGHFHRVRHGSLLCVAGCASWPLKNSSANCRFCWSRSSAGDAKMLKRAKKFGMTVDQDMLKLIEHHLAA
jgi:hypothetical protein